MRILVAGGLGFIGTNVCMLALEKGYKVVAFDNMMRLGVDENLKILSHFDNFSYVWGDIRSMVDFNDLEGDFDGIINLAANPAIPKSFKNPVQDFLINTIGQLNILEYSRSHGKIPIILASSNKVYTDRTNELPLKELATRYEIQVPFPEPAPFLGFDEYTDIDGVDGYTNSPYGVAKIAAEKYSREYAKHYGVPVVVNRMSCIYGLFQKGVQDQGWVDWFVRAKKFGYPLTIFGDGKQVRDCLFGNDVAELYLLELKKIKELNGKVFNVGGGNSQGFTTSLLELVHLLDETYDGEPLLVKYTKWRPSDQRVYISDITKVIQHTGWMPKTRLIDGIQMMWNSL